METPCVDPQAEHACYDFLVGALHPEGLRCPGCGGERRRIHRSRRAPVVDYRCPECGRVFNAWTGTPLQGTSRRSAELAVIMQSIARGVPTARLARELGCSRRHLLKLRQRLRQQCRGNGEGGTPVSPPVSRHADEVGPELIAVFWIDPAQTAGRGHGRSLAGCAKLDNREF